MKGFFRKASSILLILSLCLGVVPFTALDRAEGAGVIPRALPDSGTYDLYQNVILSSEAGATITYSVYGRATVPNTLYLPGVNIPVEEDVILSVTSSAGGVTTHKDFSYTINPRVVSTYPSSGSTNASVRPTISVQFSREMDGSLLENEDNITIKKVSNSAEIPRTSFTGTYSSANNTLTIALSVNLDAGAAYTVSIKNIKDSNGKALQGSSEFTFTTAGASYPTYGSVTTNLTYYQDFDIVNISGNFVQNGQEVTADPLVPALQLLVINPNGVLDTTLNVSDLDSGQFYTTYTIGAGAVTGTWKIRLYDNSTPRQYLNECTFTVGTVATPTADRMTGSYFEAITVNLHTITAGALIYYTTDDHISDANLGSSCTLYQGAVTISSNCTLRAVAIKGGVKSSIMIMSYTIDTVLGALSFVPDRLPFNHPTNVSINTPVSVTFGRPVLSDSITTNFSLIEMDSSHVDVPGAFVAGSVSYDAVNRKATFTPTDPLKPNTHYRGILGAGIQDLSGVHISAAVDDDWFFETGSGQQIAVDVTNANGITITVDVIGNTVTVNRNPVKITVTSTDASVVTINGVQATSTGSNQFFSNVALKTGSNTVTVVVIDNQSVSRTTVITVNYLNLMQPGATVVAAIPAKGKLDLFDKQLAMVFPKGSYLYDAVTGAVLSDQSLTFTLTQIPRADGFPAVSQVFSIDPVTTGALLNNKGESTLTLTFDKYVSTASGNTLTVLCDPDNDGVWEENLGGKVDSKKKTITVPFGYFGRYVVVNKVWNFRDYSSKGWAAAYVEYLWAKGIMKPLISAGPGNFGLVDSQGSEVSITRGEFAALMGRALGLNKANYYEYNVFADMTLTGTAAYAKDLDGIWQPIDLDDYKYVDMMARNGVLSGSLDRNNDLVFNYHNYITREEVAVILSRAMGLAVETDDAKVAAAITKMYTDAGISIAVWAQPYVLATSKGYFGGFPDKTFKGQDNFTRPQSARIIFQAMQKAKLM